MIYERKKNFPLTFIFIMACILLLSACTKEPVSYDYDFVNTHWTRDIEGDTEYIHFSEDGSFSYYCACGNPVNDSDLCEGYTYDEETDLITLDYAEKTKETISKIKLVECTDETLKLDFDGDIRVFVPEPDEEEYIAPDTITYEETNAYYEDDANYTWSIEVDSVDMEEVTTYPLTISAEDLAYIYNLENAEKEVTLSFDDIEIFGTLKKTSADGFIYGSISLAFYEDAWYWRSEIIDENTEGWPEYVYKLPDALNTQIATLMSQE